MTWQTDRPLQPPPGIDLVDKICLAADQRERQQAQAPDRMEQMMAACATMMQQQSAIIALLAHRWAKEDRPVSKVKKP
jgi:hypothetical protein